MNRKISLSIEDIYIKYAGEAFGATGSHNALTLRMIFGSAWDGTAKTAYFTDALGSASVSIVLGLDKLVGGAYEVDVPSEALKYAGEATVTIKGVLTSGDTTTKAITTAAGHFRVLDSELPESAGNAGTITASDKEQLQAEIAGMETLFTTAKAAAESAAANAKASETVAASSASSAEASKTAAAESSAAAAASANTAGSAAAAAVKNASHAAESAKAAENTAKSIVTEEAARQAAEKVRQANETIRQNAESARQTAETNRAQTETARNVWEDYDSAKNYQPGNKAYWQGSSYVCLKACSGISPENGTYWQLVVRSGFTSDSAFGFDVVNGRLLCYYSGDNPPPFRLGSDGHLHVDLDKSYDLGKVAGDGGYSPTAKVEATADGAKITITDKDGTTEATVKNGKDGADGAPGKDGTNGTNGITPTIGDNGNWYLGNTDTGKPSRGPAGQDGAGMDVTGAAVGQIAKISAVDSDGKPTAWEPTALPSGGKTWEKIGEWTVPEGSQSVKFTQKIENLNTYQQIKAIVVFPAHTPDTDKTRVGFLFGKGYQYFTYRVGVNATYPTVTLIDLFICDNSIEYVISANNIMNSGPMYGTNLSDLYPLRKGLIEFSAASPSALSGIFVDFNNPQEGYLDGTSIRVYGVKV